MRRVATPAIALALGCASAFALASCGGGEDAKLLPGATAREITENLDAVRQLAEEEECVGAADAAQSVSGQVEELGGVDEKLKRALEAGARRLNEVVAHCQEEEVTTESIEPSTEETTTEGDEGLPPGQEKKAEKEREKEEEKLEKEEEKQEEHEQPPVETTPAEPPTTTPPPPSEAGGTGAPGGVSPGEPAPPGEG